jgi:uncharacterized protein YndB with AHSA1/START domain
MKIEKSTQIARPLPEVFAYLKQTKNQDNFSVWNMTDPSMNKEYHGIDGTVGFIYSWDSTVKNVGAGEQEITVIEEGKMIGYEVRFSKPMKNVGKVSFLLSAKDKGETMVTWIFDSPSKFPFSLFAPIFKRMLGKDLEKGLVNLKSILEKS